jgi:signal transduction histidine kinase
MRLFPKLALLVSGLLLAAVLGLSALYYMSEERLIRQEAQAHQQELLQNLVLIAQDAYFSTDDLLLATYTHSLLKWNPELISASVVDPHGRIKAHSEPHNIGKMSDGAAPSSALLLSQSVKYGRLYLGTASVMFSQKVLDALLQARLAELQKRVLSLTVFVLFLGLVGSFGMALSWTRPIKRVIAGAEAIGRGRWDVDLGGSERRRDELGILSRSIGAMAGELKELDQMKEDFVTSVTHELRSPLGAIECFLNKIADERRLGRPPTQWDDYHNRMAQNVQRLTRFVNDLLDVAALDRGKVQLQPEVVDAAALAREAVALFEASIEKKRMRLDLEVAEGLPKVLADPDKITQVLDNLLSNAIKFTPEGGRIRLQLEDLSPRPFVQISVIDSGLGIRPEDQAKIFNKFEQVKSTRQKIRGPKGTGLGLTICRSLIELHGGELRVRSQEEEGSTFSFTLPVAPAAVEAFALT